MSMSCIYIDLIWSLVWGPTKSCMTHLQEEFNHRFPVTNWRKDLFLQSKGTQQFTAYVDKLRNMAVKADLSDATAEDLTVVMGIVGCQNKRGAEWITLLFVDKTKQDTEMHIVQQKRWSGQSMLFYHAEISCQNQRSHSWRALHQSSNKNGRRRDLNECTQPKLPMVQPNSQVQVDGQTVDLDAPPKPIPAMWMWLEGTYTEIISKSKLSQTQGPWCQWFPCIYFKNTKSLLTSAKLATKSSIYRKIKYLIRAWLISMPKATAFERQFG